MKDLGPQNVIGMHMGEDQPLDRQLRLLADGQIQLFSDPSGGTRINHGNAVLTDNEPGIGDVGHPVMAQFSDMAEMHKRPGRKLFDLRRLSHEVIKWLARHVFKRIVRVPFDPLRSHGIATRRTIFRVQNVRGWQNMLRAEGTQAQRGNNFEKWHVKTTF